MSMALHAGKVAVAVGLAATVAPSAIAHADGAFRLPSGNIACTITSAGRDKEMVICEIAEHSYLNPPRPPDCHLGGWGNRIAMEQGGTPVWRCHGDALLADGLPMLPYGQTAAGGPITCISGIDGVTCADSSTTHFFRVSRESYQLG
jgi:hypothetical protein